MGNLLAWQAPGYMTLIAARLLTGTAHWRIRFLDWLYHRDEVWCRRSGFCLSLLCLVVLTVALVAGVPLGTFIGQHFGWRETFLAVSLLGVIAPDE